MVGRALDNSPPEKGVGKEIGQRNNSDCDAGRQQLGRPPRICFGVSVNLLIKSEWAEIARSLLSHCLWTPGERTGPGVRWFSPAEGSL